MRISQLKTAYYTGFDETFSCEVFQIYRRYNRGRLPVYRLQDMQQEEIKGTFYESEL